MRFITTCLLLLVTQWSFAGADYVREKKWADEIVPGIVMGDPVYLELNQGHKFLALYTEVASAKTGLVVIHGMGIHPDWNMMGTLRSQLAEQGYTTLSIQMPVLAADAKSEDYLPLFTEAEERINVAVSFLQAKGYARIAIVSHSLGSAMSHRYVEKYQDKLFAWASLGIGHRYTYSKIKLPVLDLYGEHDLPPVLNMAKKRKLSLKGNLQSRQVFIPKSDHFYNNHEDEMVHVVKQFLDGVK